MEWLSKEKVTDAVIWSCLNKEICVTSHTRRYRGRSSLWRVLQCLSDFISLGPCPLSLLCHLPHCLFAETHDKMLGEGNGSPLQYSCLENPVDRGARWAAVHGVAQSQTWLKRLSSSSMIRWVPAITVHYSTATGKSKSSNQGICTFAFSLMGAIYCAVLGHSVMSNSLPPHGL